MGIQEDLNSIYSKYNVHQKGKPYTNTSMNPKKSLFIPDNEYDEFLRIYGIAITNGIHLHFTEKPLNPSPLRIDLDFRFPSINTEDNNAIKRYYTNENIDKIMMCYNKILCEYLDINEEYNLGYLMEKSNPSLQRNKIKDGIHIVYPHIILTNNEQHLLEKKH